MRNRADSRDFVGKEATEDIKHLAILDAGRPLRRSRI